MSELITWNLTSVEIDELRQRLNGMDEIIPFAFDVKFAATVATLGMQREVGTLNDEMARFLFDINSGQVINRESLRAVMVRFGGAVGVRIWSLDTDRIDLRFPGIRSMLNPRFSFNELGEVRQLVIFPESIFSIMKTHNVDTVLVKPWALNTVFGAFHPSTNYYQTNLWELSNNDTMRFSQLVAARQVPFLGTHDFVAHIAGTDGKRWELLQKRGLAVRAVLDRYFYQVRTPSLTSLVLPYVAGVLLDDLAQPSSYDDETRIIPLELVCQELEKQSIRPGERRVLSKFPAHYEKLIDLARFKPLQDVQQFAAEYVKNLVAELLGMSVHLS